MQIHASCAAKDGDGVLLIGPSGSGKSDLMLRLLDRGFELVADDQVAIEHGVAHPPAGLAGLLEVRGLGLLQLPHRAEALLRLVVQLDVRDLDPCNALLRLPRPAQHAVFGLPVVTIHPGLVSAAQRVSLALDCALGRIAQRAGAFS